MASTTQTLNAAIAVTRFGLGARPGDIDTVSHDPKGWLSAQIKPVGAPQPQGEFADSKERLADLAAYRQQRPASARTTASPVAQPSMAMTATQADAGMATMASAQPASGSDTPRTSEAQDVFDARREARRDIVQDTAHEFLMRTQLGATTDQGFAERWALFWANGFTVSATKFQSAAFIGQYEREAIRPHVFGRFEDLAVAAEQHPAMLNFLDQVGSIGPDSPAGLRRKAGLNENLAREIMELHTVGADSGYSQADVTEFARALTGWSLPQANGQGQGQGSGQGQAGRGRRATLAQADPDAVFVFRANVHEPGERTVMGKRYPASGQAQGETILRDLANRPETAKRLSRRIAAHFVADDPPPALVARLEKAWMDSGGRLDVVAKALIEAPEAWVATPGKIKTPYEFVVSTHRALNQPPQRIQPLQQALAAMGQPAFSAPSPKGWPDTAADWAGPDALVKRLDWSKTVADRSQAAVPVTVAMAALGDRLSERTRLAVSRAESRPEALTLFFMSPEFQRR